MGQACTNCNSGNEDAFNTTCVDGKIWCGGNRTIISDNGESRAFDNDSILSFPELKNNANFQEILPDSFYSDQVKSKNDLFSPINQNPYDEDIRSNNKSKERFNPLRISHKIGSSSRQNSTQALGTLMKQSRNSALLFQEEEELITVEDFELVDHSRYTGTVKKAANGFEIVKHGYGLQMWKDGAKYEGEWLNGKANGRGTFYHINGDIYEGDFRDDRANGNGVYYHKNGSKYQGTWRDDLKDGFGREEWDDGSYYEGSFKAGCKHGQGIYKWADDSCYDGVWVHNNIEGHGKYTWPDGRIYEGSWKDNKLHGKGLYSWGDGRKYDGFYVEDKKQGFGTYFWPDGRKYEGYWHDGKQHGEGKFYNTKGKCKVGYWEDGNRIKWLSSKVDQSTPTLSINTSNPKLIKQNSFIGGSTENESIHHTHHKSIQQNI